MQVTQSKLPFLTRYLTNDGEIFTVQERYLAFVDCFKKSGLEVANLIFKTLEKYGIPIADCRGQGYDNAANMPGRYTGAQQHVNLVNPDIYNLFPCSPRRWDILLSHVGSSLHGLSCTKWTDRVASVRPFAAHLPGIKKALEELLLLNLNPKTTIKSTAGLSMCHY